jgi:hypothetical protein
MTVHYYYWKAGETHEYSGTPDELEAAISPARYKVATLLQEAQGEYSRRSQLTGISLVALESKIKVEVLQSVLHEIDDLPNHI